MSEEALIAAGGAGAAAIIGKALIDKVSEAIGGYLKPWQIERVANAEAAAALIKAHNEVQLTDILKRAAFRHLEEETIHQAHMEEVVRRAQQHLTEHSKPEEMSNDWLRFFFEKARLAGEEDMQDVWAKILAGEANSPGRFSKRTLSIVSDFSKEDAELFLNLGSLSVSIRGNIQPIIFQKPIASKVWIKERDIRHLEALGVLYFTVTGFSVPLHQINERIDYFSKSIKVKKGGVDESFDIGQVTLTAFGAELYNICNCGEVEGFFEELLRYWAPYRATEFFPSSTSVT